MKQYEKFTEEWSRWEPNITGLGGTYHIIETVSQACFFKVVLEHEKLSQKIEILFYCFTVCR